MSPDMKITQVKSNGKSLKNIELPDVMTAIRSGEQARVVNEHRGILSSSMPGDRNIHATDIPVLLFAARFRKKESRIEYQAYNGLVLMDVGNLADREEAVAVKRLASLAPQTMAAFVGSSGKSVKILVPFVLPDGSLPEKRELAELFHAVAYRRAVAFYQAHLQRHIEMGEEASLERGCRHSFDPGLYYNPSATPLIQEQPMQMPAEPTYREVVAKEEDPLLRMMPGYDRSRIVSRFYNACMLDALEKTGGLDGGKEVRPFLTRLAENCFRSGIPEEDVVRWTKISRNLELFEEEIRETIHMVYQLSKCFGKKPVMPAEQLLSIKTDEFMKRRYEFRRNMLAGEVEFRARGSYYIHFAPVTETVLNSIGLNAQAEGLALWDRDVKRYVYSDRVPVFYPLEDYLEYLPEWDGKDHIRALADTLPTANAQWRNLFYVGKLGQVFVFNLENTLLRGLMGKGAAALREILSVSDGSDLFSPECMAQYFSLFYSNCNTFDKADIKGLLYKGFAEMHFMFATAAEKFRLIDDKDSVSILIGYGDGATLLEELKRIGPEFWLLRKLQQYSVSIRKWDFEELVRCGKVIEYSGVFILEDPNCYDLQAGLVLDGAWAEELLLIE